MLSIIWSLLILISIVFSILSGRGDEIVGMLTSSVQKGASLFITLAPLMCFWSGIMEIAEQSNLTALFARLLSPLTRILFPQVKNDSEAMEKISMNMSANLLGMGNAATPLGLCAMERLDKINPTPSKASDAMCMFVVVNTASIQIIPSSVISLRSQFGSVSPSDLLPAVWITTLSAFIIGTLCVSVCRRREKI